jgi:hypothetical protein
MSIYKIVPGFLICFMLSYGNNISGNEAEGFIAPSGPPSKAPLKKDVGTGCLVELTQPYKISGTLSGSLEIDYRILVYGSCGKPPGTYDEEWIAYGSFNGTIEGKSGSGKFSYTANVKAGGDINGKMIFGQGVDGKLNVKGNFNDGKISYDGWIDKN